jgi:transcriptional regulator with XRE-family HTH domain
MGEGPIRARRELLNLKISTVVKRTRIDPARLMELEAGLIAPTFAELEVLSLALGVAKEHLVLRQDDMDDRT